jgi:Ca-activated chloride channel family protein
LSDDVLAQDDVPASIVLLSDGATTVGRPVLLAADAAADAGIPVTTIAFGTPSGTVTIQGEVVQVPADTVTMAAVADRTGGSHFEATTAGELQAVYTDIQADVGYTTEQREVTRPLLGIALATVLGAAVLGLLWTARPL